MSAIRTAFETTIFNIRSRLAGSWAVADALGHRRGISLSRQLFADKPPYFAAGNSVRVVDWRGNSSLAGLWTPIAGAIVALIELWKIFAAPYDTWAYVFAATLAAALAMIGPGAWSLDARLFGWKRIDSQER